MRAKADVWAERIRGWRASGLQAEKYVEGKEFTARSLRWWDGEFARRTRKKTKSSAPIAMARVVAPGEVIAEVQASETPLSLMVGRYRVAVSRGFDEVVLRDLLRVLAEAE